MSLYNAIHGMNAATFFVLPVLGKHPDLYPRFRDCFVRDEEHPEHDGRIQVYTRVGGGNREGWQDCIDELRAMPGYVTDYDDSFDSTFATFVFDVPEQWAADVQKVQDGKIKETSPEYQALILRTFPKIADKLRAAFAPAMDEERADAEEWRRM